MEQTIHLLAIDLENAPSAARDAFALNVDELASLSAKARLERPDSEVVVLAEGDRFEIYTTEAARQTVYRTLLATIVARIPHEQRAAVRTTQHGGVAAAWHLMHVTAGADGRSGVRTLGAMNDAVIRARRAGTLGSELAALFECAANAGWRIQSETTLGDRETPPSQRELDWFEAERIIDEELVTWQASRASQGSLQSIPVKSLDPSYYAAAEAGTGVRLKAPRAAGLVQLAEATSHHRVA